MIMFDANHHMMISGTITPAIVARFSITRNTKRVGDRMSVDHSIKLDAR